MLADNHPLSDAVWHGFAVKPRWPSRETQRFLCGHLMAILKGDANWTLDESEKQHLVQKMVWLSEPLSDDGQLISFRQVRDVLSARSEEHTSELQSLMRISYAVFCLNKKNKKPVTTNKKNRLSED